MKLLVFFCIISYVSAAEFLNAYLVLNNTYGFNMTHHNPKIVDSDNVARFSQQKYNRLSEIDKTPCITPPEGDIDSYSKNWDEYKDFIYSLRGKEMNVGKKNEEFIDLKIQLRDDSFFCGVKKENPCFPNLKIFLLRCLIIYLK
jgi:hypothetical protein